MSASNVVSSPHGAKDHDDSSGNRTARPQMDSNLPPATSIQAPPSFNTTITDLGPLAVAPLTQPRFTSNIPGLDLSTIQTHGSCYPSTNGGLSSSRHNPDFLDRTHARRLEIEDRLSALRRRLFDVTRMRDEGGLEDLYKVLVKGESVERGPEMG